MSVIGNELFVLPKYSARLATSSLEQNRPVGCLAVNIFIASSSDIPFVPATRPRKLDIYFLLYANMLLNRSNKYKILIYLGVSTVPGRIALQRMPFVI